MAETTTRKKAEVPLECPRCKVAPEVRRRGSYWLHVCPNNVSVLSSCKLEGWTMGTKRESIEQWNIAVRAAKGEVSA